MELVDLSWSSLAVPLREPFVIATTRVDTTLGVTVRVSTREAKTAGLGEGATLPTVTPETVDDVVNRLDAAAVSFRGARCASLDDVATLLEPLGAAPVARAGAEVALLDALFRHQGLALRDGLARYFASLSAAPGRPSDAVVLTDITLPILDAATMTALGRKWHAAGFRSFKVKVGKDVDADATIVLSLARDLSGASFRLDANGGYDEREAFALLDALESRHVALECFEQPTARENLAALAAVTRRARCPVIADEAVRSLADLEAIARERAATGVNLKICKLGGLVPCLTVAARARELGLAIMVGGMVETRLGMAAAAHLAAAIGGVEFCDLDTAFLLAEERFRGGYEARGPRLALSSTPGLGVRECEEGLTRQA